MRSLKKIIYAGSLYLVFSSFSVAYALPILVNTETEQSLIDTVYTTLDCEGYLYYQITTTYTYKITFEKEKTHEIDYTIHKSEFEYKFLKNPCFDDTVKEKLDFCTKQPERSLGGDLVYIDKHFIEIEKYFKKYKIEYIKIPFDTCKDCDHTIVPEPSSLSFIVISLLIGGMFFLTKKMSKLW